MARIDELLRITAPNNVCSVELKKNESRTKHFEKFTFRPYMKIGDITIIYQCWFVMSPYLFQVIKMMIVTP